MRYRVVINYDLESSKAEKFVKVVVFLGEMDKLRAAWMQKKRVAVEDLSTDTKMFIDMSYVFQMSSIELADTEDTDEDQVGGHEEETE